MRIRSDPCVFIAWIGLTEAGFKFRHANATRRSARNPTLRPTFRNAPTADGMGGLPLTSDDSCCVRWEHLPPGYPVEPTPVAPGYAPAGYRPTYHPGAAGLWWFLSYGPAWLWSPSATPAIRSCGPPPATGPPLSWPPVRPGAIKPGISRCGR